MRALTLFLLLAPLAPATATAEISPEKAYVQGRLALAGNQLDIASDAFALAIAASDSDQLKRQALNVAILAGDAKEAARLANAISLDTSADARTTAGNSLIALTRLATAAARKDWRAYDAGLQAFGEPATQGDAIPVMRRVLAAWGDAARRRYDDALLKLEPGEATGASLSYLKEHRAHMLAVAGRWAEAAVAYSEIVSVEGANVPRLRLAAAATALEAGARDPAWRERGIAILAGGPASDPLLDKARSEFGRNPRMSGRKLDGLLSGAEEGIAQLFLRIAVELASNRGYGLALSFARLAGFADPDLPEARLVTADILARDQKLDLALQTLDGIKSLDAPWPELAAARTAALLAGDARYDEARKLLAAKAASPDATAEDWLRLADVERLGEHREAAVASFGKSLQLLPDDADDRQRAYIHFLRGSTYERMQNWPLAEADLRKAVELVPDNSVYLNYLGYSLLDRGQSRAEAVELISRAFEASPENGAIIDSMGWAHYVQGDYKTAVELLERARAAEPGDPTISEHLGDALWQLGRKIEARHAWTAALELDPEKDVADRIAQKRDFGLRPEASDAR